MKKQPVRTCLGCGKRFPKSQLIKFVLQNGRLLRDSIGSGQGRSAYCCNNEQCLAAFFRQTRKMYRAFRVREGQISFALRDGE